MSRTSFAATQYRRMLISTMTLAVVTFVLSVLDTVFAGHLFGETALAGVNLVMPVGILVLFVGNMIAFGASISRVFAVGRCDRARMDSCCSTGLWAALAAGAVLAALFAFRGTYFRAMGVTGDALVAADAYCRGFWLVALVQPLDLLVSALVLSDGGHRHSRAGLIANVLAKGALSLPFARWFGLAGLAYATAAGFAVQLGVLAFYLRTKSCTLRFLGGFSFSTFLSGVRFSVTDQFDQFGDMFVMLVVNAFVVAVFGEKTLPVVSAFSTVSLFGNVAEATQNAVQPVMGVYFGERNFRRVREIAAYGLRFAALISGVAGAILFVFPELVLLFIGLDSPELQASARLAVRLAAAFLVVRQVASYADAYFLYIERIGLSLAMTILDSSLLPVGMGVVLGLLSGEAGFWTGLAAAPGFVLAGSLVFAYFRYGRAMFPFVVPADRDAKLFVYDLALTEGEITGVSEKVMRTLERFGLYKGAAVRAPLIVEEALMIVKDRNAGRRILAEVTLDLNDGVALTLRDDGEIFNLTDADAKVSSLRAYLVSSVMSVQSDKLNLATTGFNRNRFEF